MVLPYKPIRRTLGAVIYDGMGAMVGSGDDYYSADDIVGQTLIAKKDTPIYLSAYDNAVSMGVVKAGQPIGVVYSWVGPKAGTDGWNRSQLWWCFVETSGMWYYTPHVEGQFDTSNIKQSGVLTVDEKRKAEAETQKRANMSWWEIAMHDYGMPIALAAIALFAAPGIIRSFKK